MDVLKAPFVFDHLAQDPMAAQYQKRKQEMANKLQDGNVMWSGNGQKMMPGGAKVSVLCFSALSLCLLVCIHLYSLRWWIATSS